MLTRRSLGRLLQGASVVLAATAVVMLVLAMPETPPPVPRFVAPVSAYPTVPPGTAAQVEPVPSGVVPVDGETPSSHAPAATLAPLDVPEQPTRVAIPALAIDLPVIEPTPDEAYPMCGVAEVDQRFSPVLSPVGLTMLYAHARQGMFGALWHLDREGQADTLIGTEILLWTDALRLHRYRVTAVYRDQYDFALTAGVTDGQLWLQTCTSVRGDGPKMFVVAKPTGEQQSDAGWALPGAAPFACA